MWPKSCTVDSRFVSRVPAPRLYGIGEARRASALSRVPGRARTVSPLGVVGRHPDTPRIAGRHPDARRVFGRHLDTQRPSSVQISPESPSSVRISPENPLSARSCAVFAPATRQVSKSRPRAFRVSSSRLPPRRTSDGRPAERRACSFLPRATGAPESRPATPLHLDFAWRRDGCGIGARCAVLWLVRMFALHGRRMIMKGPR